MTRASRWLVGIKLRATSDVLASGVLRICAGPPGHADAAADQERVLSTVLFSGAVFAVDEVAGTATARDLRGVVARDGIASWWQACAADGRPLLSGTVGKGSASGADLVLNRIDLLAGDRVEVETFMVEAVRAHG